MTSGGPFSRAVHDFHRGEQTEPLYSRDGPEKHEHPIEAFYFTDFDPAATDTASWLTDHVEGPLLDMGAGAGRHARYFQERFETVAIEPTDPLVTVMAERGVEDARVADMFALREHFDRDRFRSAIAIGTQVCLAGSMTGLREFLGELAHVTTPEATAIFDAYDPTPDYTATLPGYRADPTTGLASRIMQFEYEGDLSTPIYFRLFSPDRLREATTGTGWTVAEIRHIPDEANSQYWARLEKR